ncbi:MAG: hypothetical protein GY791_20480 [Alphaproteobacteria bacterium]|nr:hypothetical protein [Alphaproteobacteria bacterium]
MNGLRRIPVVILLTILFFPPFDAAAEGDAEAGRKLAAQHCTRCHVVGDINPYGGIDSTPSFRLLVGMADYDERFGTFYARRPHPVFVRIEEIDNEQGSTLGAAAFTISVTDIEDLLAFVERLQSEQ